MAPKSAQDVYNEIVAHIKKEGSPYASWYCGITSNINNRVFGDHKVPQKDHWYMTRECHTDDAARKVEDALLNLGCDGGAGGGDQTSVYVYAYRKTAITDP